MLEGTWLEQWQGVDHLKLSPDSSASSNYKRAPMQPALSNQSVHSVMHFEIEFHRLILFTATPAIWLGCVCNVRAHNASWECLLKIGIMLKWSYYNYIKRMHWKSDCCGFTEPLISRHTSCTTTRAWDAFLMPLKKECGLCPSNWVLWRGFAIPNWEC